MGGGGFMQHAVSTNNSDKNQKAGRRKKFKGNQSDKTSYGDRYKMDFPHLSEEEIIKERKRIDIAHRKSRKKRVVLYLFIFTSIVLSSILYFNYSKQKTIEFEYRKITGLTLPQNAIVKEFKSKISSRDAKTYTLFVQLNEEEVIKLKKNISQNNFAIIPNYRTSLELNSYIKNYSDIFTEQLTLNTGSKQFRFIRFYNDNTVLLISNAKFLTFDPPKKVVKKGPFK